MDGPFTDLVANLGPISLAPMVASSRIDRGERAANRCAKDASLTDLEATVWGVSSHKATVTLRRPTLVTQLVKQLNIYIYR